MANAMPQSMAKRTFMKYIIDGESRLFIVHYMYDLAPDHTLPIWSIAVYGC